MTQAAQRAHLAPEAEDFTALKVDIGTRIRLLREKAGITQDELSAKTDKSRSAVAQWEAGNAAPDIITVLRLSVILNTTPQYIAFGVSEKTAENLTIATVDVTGPNTYVRTGAFDIPRAFAHALGRGRKALLVAVPVTRDGELPGYYKGDVVLVDYNDKELVGQGSAHVIHDGTAAMLEAFAVSRTDNVRVTLGRHEVELARNQVPVFGRIVGALRRHLP